MLTTTLCLALLAMAGNPAATPAAWGPLPLLRHLELDLDLDPDRGTLGGHATLRLEGTDGAAPSSVPFLLNRLLTVDSVQVDGTAARWQQSIERLVDFDVWQVRSLRVQLDGPLPPGGQTAISIWYHGRIAPYTETGMRYVRDRVDTEFTLLRADALAFPVVGSLSLAENREAPREAFRFDARVTAPEGMRVVNGAELVERTRQGATTRWHYRSTDGVPFLLIAAARYLEFSRGGVTVFAFPEDSAGGEAVLATATAATGQLARWFGPPQPGAHVTVIEIPEGWGSQASATGGIIQTADAFRTREELTQLHHELSHLWNARDVDPPSARWNEGLASWLQYRVAGALDPRMDADSALEHRYQRLRAVSTADSSWAGIPMAEFGRAGLTDRSYLLGAIAFDLLANALGEDEFDRRYRDYLQSHWEEGVTLAGLREAMTRGAPAGAIAVVRDWIDGTGWVARLGATPSLKAMRSRYR